MVSTFGRLAAARPFFLIAGPNVIESREHCLRMAHAIAVVASRLNLELVYKASFDKANRTSLSEGTTGKGAEPSMFSEQYDRSLARIQAKDRAYNEGLRSRKEARRAETLERMHRQIRNRKDMEQTVANWT